jgi:hypothetical protein
MEDQNMPRAGDRNEEIERVRLSIPTKDEQPSD